MQETLYWQKVDDDVDNMYEDMVQNIISAAEKCIPRTSPKCRQKRLPYFNQNCRDAVYARNRARWLGGVVVRALDLRLEIAGSIPAAALLSATLDKLFIHIVQRL